MMPTSTARVHGLSTLETSFFRAVQLLSKQLLKCYIWVHMEKIFSSLKTKKNQKSNRQLFLRDTKLKAPITEKDTCQATSPKCTFVYFKMYLKKTQDGQML